MILFLEAFILPLMGMTTVALFLPPSQERTLPIELRLALAIGITFVAFLLATILTLLKAQH